MFRYIAGVTLASLIVGAAQADEFKRLPLKEAAKAIPYLAPLSLEADRTLCVSNKQKQLGHSDMNIYSFCKAVLHETAMRYKKTGDENLILETYQTWSWKYPNEVIRGVAQASLKDEARFVSVRDEDQQRVWMPLSCPLAYDVGYFYGLKNPKSGIGYNKVISQPVSKREACFTDGNASRKSGFLAGTVDGRGSSNQVAVGHSQIAAQD